MALEEKDGWRIRAVILAEDEKVVPCRDVGIDLDETCRVIIPAKEPAMAYASRLYAELHEHAPRRVEEFLQALLIRSEMFASKEER